MSISDVLWQAGANDYGLLYSARQYRVTIGGGRAWHLAVAEINTLIRWVSGKL